MATFPKSLRIVIPALALTTIPCLPAVLADSPSTGHAPSQAERAQTAVRTFGESLKAELVRAMQSGGPLKAIEVCNIEAPTIAEAVSLDHGVRVSRVSLKNRNPNNAPNDWQETVLKQFEARKLDGEAVSGMSWQETVETDGGQEFRFMKPIATGVVCLHCHGENLAPPVQEKIAELYPQDQATGFRQGDIRGAFVVVDRAGDDS
jgi:hypothetical protein